MSEDFIKDGALKGVVQQQANANLFLDSVHSAKSIVSERTRAWAMREVALHASSGETTEALSIAFSMSDPEKHVMILTGLIEVIGD